MRLLAGHPTVDDPEAFLEDIRSIGDENDVAVQAFDARFVAGRDHLERALELARRERARGEGIADTLAVEVLCYAAGRRQITDALTMGVGESTDSVVVMLVETAENAGDHPEEAHQSLDRASGQLTERFDLADPATDADARATLESIDESTLESFFDVSASEREAALAGVPDLVAERVALLVVNR
jgi:KEOPS complex subunit Cgi121